MIAKKIYYKLTPRAAEHNACTLANVQAGEYLDLTMLGLSRPCNSYQSYISDLTTRF